MATPSSMGPIQHGGNQASIRARLKLGDRPLVDFSAPLNGMGPPGEVMEQVGRALATLDRYPEPDAPRLKSRLAEFHGVSPRQILVGAGTTELISLLTLALREPQKLGLGRRAGSGAPGRGYRWSDPAPTHVCEPIYGEYRRSAVLSGLPVHVWPGHMIGWEQDFFPEGETGAFWTCSPNNPTGRTWERERLLAHVDASPELLTIVDEAYLPFLPDEVKRTVVGDVAERHNLVVLRSMTKIYAIAGMRVGYVVAPEAIVQRLRQCQQPWTVAATAEAAALAAVDDDAYLQRTIDLIESEAPRVLERLWTIPGLRPAWPGPVRPAKAAPLPNFLLVSLADTPWTSSQLQDALAYRGLFVRECSNYRGLEPGGVVTGRGGLRLTTRGHIRITVRTPAENDRLLQVLGEVMTQEPAKVLPEPAAVGVSAR